MIPTDNRFRRLCQALDYAFQKPELLRQALTHRSYGAGNNERFEFVGDSILNYTVARMLFDQFPKLTEGELSRLRANLVNQNTLAEIAHELKLGDYLYLGEGELKSGGFNRPSILADALEATFAAVSFDSDFLRAEQVVRRLYAERVSSIDTTRQAKDAKTRLQEALQARKLALPKYRILLQSGEAHEQWFRVECDLGELAIGSTGEGGSRRAAEQQAAEAALILLEQKLAASKKRI
ncbi:ribonuclease III [Chromobacterium haemolyticum]|uniref:Ribonuclease 3 n=2 Tax=Chromobacterium TaxID=535 RepID=A0A1W0D001_9NEIS|nr:ribonuclease III [Chromobacterium rhizoryzae]MBK0413331.1 ribonuclease III [Chromobacterium haemolyticum]QOZ83908.1 ribonuclease III [Chromobacterium sp. Rain0013]MBO0414433.1 ribonuclease III [Chromobacterium haemolyticum]MBO0497708.1 ribonuclease III [Chromobacterium haemolyticum]